MKVSRQDDSTRTATHNLLDIVPNCLIQAEEFSMMADSLKRGFSRGTDDSKLISEVADYLIGLLADCLQIDRDALDAAENIVSRLPRRRHKSFQVAAAWDTFIGQFELKPDENLRHFLLLDYWSFQASELLTELVRGHETPPSSPMATAQILACRHLLGSTVGELAAIHALLPNASFTEILGKPYSASRAAVLELERRGFPVDHSSLQSSREHSSSFGQFANDQKSSARAAVDRLIANSGNETGPLLVIDDGGALIDAVGQAVRAGRLRRPVIAIEQTTHGMFAVRPFLKEASVRTHGFAVVNVAESYGKLIHESPIIAKSIVNESLEWLRYRYPTFPHHASDLRIGVIGYGTVGSYVVAQLRGQSLNVRIYDRSRHKTSVAGANGVPIARSINDLLGNADVIIGATGGVSIDSDAAEKLRDGVILISASSGDKEFAGLHGWRMVVTPLLPRRDRPDSFDQVHGLRTAYSLDGRRVYIANGGFPVNFDGSIDPIRPDLIQLTRSLMIAAVIQASGSKSQPASIVGATGEFDLDKSLEEYIVERFHNISIRN